MCKLLVTIQQRTNLSTRYDSQKDVVADPRTTSIFRLRSVPGRLQATCICNTARLTPQMISGACLKVWWLKGMRLGAKSKLCLHFGSEIRT